MKKAEQILVDLKSAIVEIYEWPTFLETNWGTHYVAIYPLFFSLLLPVSTGQL